jgi:tetratricopeptide (TPR) repeat protein
VSSAQQNFETATALHQAGKLGEALAMYRDILMADPKNVMVMHLACLIAMQFDNPRMVLSLSENAITIEPRLAILHQDKATALRRLGVKEQALIAIDHAIALDPQADFYDTRASVLRDMRRYDEAVEALEKAQQLEPYNPKFYNNLAIILGRMGRNDDALACFDTYITMNPHAENGYNNKANILKSLGRYDEAIVYYDKALAINPDIFMGKANKGLCHLVRGEWEEGWTFFEHRKPGNLPPENNRVDIKKRWDGSTDKNAIILLYNEQGLGDTLQFSRYIPVVQEKVGRVIIQVQPQLKQFFSFMWPDLEIITPEDALPDYHIQSPLMSLPYTFKTRVDNVPFAHGHMHAPPDKITFWKEKLSAHQKKKVGLVWAGNPDHMNDHIRSIALPMLQSVLSVPDIQFFSLQKGEKAVSHLAELPINLRPIHLGNDLHDFTDTAGLLKNLDLLISVDTSVLHLAGSLGVPAWGLLQFDPDWRWMIKRDDTPWYNTLRLFRQPAYGDWQSVIRDVTAAL